MVALHLQVQQSSNLTKCSYEPSIIITWIIVSFQVTDWEKLTIFFLSSFKSWYTRNGVSVYGACRWFNNGSCQHMSVKIEYEKRLLLSWTQKSDGINSKDHANVSGK